MKQVRYEKSRGEMAVDLLSAYRNWIGAGAFLLAAVVGALWYVGALPAVDVPEIPEPVQAAALALVGAFALGYLPTMRLVDYLYNPPKRYLVCIGTTDQTDKYDLPPEAFKPRIVELSAAAWDTVSAVDGDLYGWEETKWPTYECEGFDPETMRAVGTWRGSKPDSELMRREKEIHELRTDLETAADQSIDLEIAISSKVRQAVKEIGQAIIEEHAEATTYNGERVADVLSEVRQEVQEDTGEDLDNGERPVRELRTLQALADSTEVSNGDGQ